MFKTIVFIILLSVSSNLYSAPELVVYHGDVLIHNMENNALSRTEVDRIYFLYPTNSVISYENARYVIIHRGYVIRSSTKTRITYLGTNENISRYSIDYGNVSVHITDDNMELIFETPDGNVFVNH